MSDEQLHKIPAETEEVHENGNGRAKEITYLPGMYRDWFLDYASYVILERAVPHLYDGLKPVQRRILHSMKVLDDGRYNKVANIIGHTMQYHPHGDASIGDALVQLGQKDLLIDCQGNWGNILTGDSAAAPRYIEARLSKFALEVVFNPKTTEWKASYDGRNKEPVYLPVKFPLLLAQGVEGIAVGLASKILPHNFNELIDASIAHLNNEPFTLLPDFPTGGNADFSKYQDGNRGGKVRVRAKIEKLDKKTLVVKEIPFGKTTSTVIDSIILANDKGKIKIRKIDDNTAANVEILIHLTPGVSPDKTIDALYAFTDCEVSISPNTCVINENKPVFLGVSEMLRISTENTLALLKQELEIREDELEADWHASSLEKIFIENRIYLRIEKCETWECIVENIQKGLEPFKSQLRRPITEEDITRLTELRIKRISRYDAKRAEDHLLTVEEELKSVRFSLAHLIDYAIGYFTSLKKKYGKNYPRKTEIRSFDTIEATRVVVANEKLYINYEEGFVGTSLKKDTFLFECSDIDDIVVFRKDGTYLVTKVPTKAFLGKNILHVGLFDRSDTRTIYNVAYRDGKNGFNYAKRFAVKGVTRDKEYDLTQGKEGSRILYFTENPNGESEVIRVYLRPKPKLKKAIFDFDFGELAIKNRNAMGNILSKHAINKITLKEKGSSTLGGRKIWFDNSVNRLNDDERGTYLGEFLGEDKILVILKNGQFRLSNYDFSSHFEENIHLIEKFDPFKVYTMVLFDAEQGFYYLKRFQIEEDTPENKLQSIIGGNPESSMVLLTDELLPRIELTFTGKHAHREAEILDAAAFIALKSFKAKGKRLSTYEVRQIKAIEPIDPDEVDLATYYGEDYKIVLGYEKPGEEPDPDDDIENGSENEPADPNDQENGPEGGVDADPASEATEESVTETHENSLDSGKAEATKPRRGRPSKKEVQTDVAEDPPAEPEKPAELKKPLEGDTEKKIDPTGQFSLGW